MANEGQPGIKGELNWIFILTLAERIQTTIAPLLSRMSQLFLTLNGSAQKT
jgi:hypothetical protein